MTRRRTRRLAAGLVALTTSFVLAGCTSDPGGSAAVPDVSTITAASSSLLTSTPVDTAVHSVAPVRPDVSSAAAPVRTPSSPPPTSNETPGPTVISTASARTPQGAAVAWLTALRTASFHDSAGGWVHAITPYVTASLEMSYRKIAASGTGGGAGWTAFVQHQCVSTLVNAAGIIPPEAPVSADTAHVQVSGTLATACRSGTKASTQFLAATVLVIKDHGRWAVATREF